MRSPRICYLKITSFSGLSLGATHYYGALQCGDCETELEHRLTRREAIAYNKVERRIKPNGTFIYREGQKTRGFTSENDIIELAIETYKKHFPNAEILLLGERGYHEPCRVLDAPESFKREMNALNAEAESFGRYVGNPKRMNTIYSRYDTLMEEWGVD